ncbi:MAG: hypothetical protein R6X25_07435 [Candidatus Krumholzibacteriia bacterium]
MSTTVTLRELEEQLARGLIVPLSEAGWKKLAPAFDEVRRQPTFIAGDIVVGRRGDRWIVVERPERGRRVVRSVGGATAADDFVQKRLEAYERAWDG